MNDPRASTLAGSLEAPTTRIALIGCSASKREQATAARDLYTSALFRKSAAYAEATCEDWFVLSAQYGLVRRDEVIEPYDRRLGRDVDSGAWSKIVQDQLASALRDVPNVLLVVLAGKQYRSFLPMCQWPSEVPMSGLGIGQQLGWLTRELSATTTSQQRERFML